MPALHHACGACAPPSPISMQLFLLSGVLTEVTKINFWGYNLHGIATP